MRYLRRCLLGPLLLVSGAHAQAIITLSAPSPASGLPGVTAVSVTATGLPGGTVTTASTQITLQPTIQGAGPTASRRP